jgi:hypothetical protein
VIPDLKLACWRPVKYKYLLFSKQNITSSPTKTEQFIGLVIVAMLIATPLCWYLMHNWLQHFDYRSTISGWIFVLTGLGALSITLITVSF